MKYLLGMDAGGTKTLCALTDTAGTILGLGLSRCGNFQVSGVESARHELKRSIERAVADAGIEPKTIAVAFYGVSGADRQKDFETVSGMLSSVNPADRMFLENDASIALRAGTETAVGLGLISGTGTNAIGFNSRGERRQVGGWGSPYLGDFGSAHDIAACAFAQAQRGNDAADGPPRCMQNSRKPSGSMTLRGHFRARLPRQLCTAGRGFLCSSGV